MSSPSPLPPLITVDTQHPVGDLYWTALGVLATREWTKINFWDVRAKLESQRGRTSRTTVNMYNATREMSCDGHVTAMTIVNEKIVVGDASGCVSVYDGSLKAKNSLLQRFADHKGPITGVYAVSVACLPLLSDCTHHTQLDIALFDSHCFATVNSSD